MRILLLAATAILLVACGGNRGGDMVSTSTENERSGFRLFGGGDDEEEDNTPQLGVNGFLWRATLDTLNFMPLSSADPIGGVVISDWYAQPERPDEHMKVTVYILDRRLRADAVRVAVFRQVRGANGWADAQTNPDTGIRLENAILSRARELRLASIAE